MKKNSASEKRITRTLQLHFEFGDPKADPVTGYTPISAGPMAAQLLWPDTSAVSITLLTD